MSAVDYRAGVDYDIMGSDTASKSYVIKFKGATNLALQKRRTAAYALRTYDGSWTTFKVSNRTGAQFEVFIGNDENDKHRQGRIATRQMYEVVLENALRSRCTMASALAWFLWTGTPGANRSIWSRPTGVYPVPRHARNPTAIIRGAHSSLPRPQSQAKPKKRQHTPTNSVPLAGSCNR
ncbi:hypothetical protein N9L68_01810 [bacterium]|nr:hypothetical protein [bacterium]